MKLITMDSARRAVIVALVLSAAFYWVVRGMASYARQSYVVSVIGSSNLVLLNGATVNLQDTEAFHVADGTKLSGQQRTLVIAETDTCPGVKEVLPRWLELIRELPSDGSVAVVVVNMGGQAVADQLIASAKAAKVPY